MRKSREFTDYLPTPRRIAPHWLPFDGDLTVAERHQAEAESAGEAADDGAERQEGEEYQYAASAFKVRGFEDLDPGEPGTDAERRPAEGPQDQPQQRKQHNFHETSQPANSRDGSRLVGPRF